MSGMTRRELVAGTAALVALAASCARSTAVDETVVAGEVSRFDYDDHPDAFGELWIPVGSDGASPAPVVVLIHGGFWRDGFLLDLMNPLVPSLLARGYAVWNIEYRRVGAGGGYPSTFEDVARAIDHVAELAAGTASLDTDRVAVVGHSAGGHLATWAAGRHSLPTGSVGADPIVRPVLAISQAGVLDLVGCVEQSVGGTACVDLIGAEPAGDRDRYTVTSPMEMVPFDATVVAIHGELDRIVPPTQSIVFVDGAVEAGMSATYVSIPDADHFSNLNPAHPAWTTVLDALDAEL